jgi:hypothetical protein
MDDRNDGVRLSRVKILGSMLGWTAFSLSITNNAGNDQTRVVYHGTKRNSESISKFTTSEDRAGCLGINATWESFRCAKPGD